jgi:5-methylcytosine-specific restriction endonuclease McrA
MKKEIRLKVFNKYGGHCAYCGCELKYKDMQVDHIHPQYLKHWLKSEVMMRDSDVKVKDIDDFENLNPSCRACNFAKGTETLEAFRREIGLKIKRIERTFNWRLLEKYGLVQKIEKPVLFYYEQYNGWCITCQ